MLSGVYCLIVCLPMIVVGSIGAYKSESFDQVSIACLDVIFLTSIMIMFLVWETQKSDDYFESKSNTSSYDKYLNLNRTSDIVNTLGVEEKKLTTSGRFLEPQLKQGKLNTPLKNNNM